MSRSNKVFTFQEKMVIVAQQNNKCAYCNTPFELGQLGTHAIQFDHFYPLSKGGPSNKLNMNIAACARCNQIKSDKVFECMRDVRLYIRGALNMPPYDEQTTIPEFMAELEKPIKIQSSNDLLDRLFSKYDKNNAS